MSFGMPENGEQTHQHVFFLRRYQKHVASFYASKRVQVLVAVLIVGNFGIQCIQKQIDPFGTKYPKIWFISENFFNIVFALELIINMYGSWCRPFFRSAWNNFDFLVVSIGLLDMVDAPLPGPLKLVRMLRAFRVFRLFGRVESLKKILMMIHRAIPGVMSAFALNFIVLCIYAVLAVDFFKDIHEGCLDLDSPPLGAVTPRGKCFGEDYYGSFLRSLYTLFQILTGESWSEAAVRPVFHFFEHSVADMFGCAVFFISFILLNAVVLLNVVVAVLIEGMQPQSAGAEDEVESLDEPELLQNGEDDQSHQKEQQDSIDLCSDGHTNGELANGCSPPKIVDDDFTQSHGRMSVKTLGGESHMTNDMLASDVHELQVSVRDMKSQLGDMSAEVRETLSALLEHSNMLKRRGHDRREKIALSEAC